MPSKVTFSSLVQGRTIPSIHLTTEEFLELHADIERFCLHKIAQKQYIQTRNMRKISLASHNVLTAAFNELHLLIYSYISDSIKQIILALPIFIVASVARDGLLAFLDEVSVFWHLTFWKNESCVFVNAMQQKR